MFEFIIVCLTAFFTSFLTLFSGFGLSTVLMPVFALFFPIPISIAATAIVHLTNNLFKAFLVGKYAEKNTVLRFGIPAGIAAVVGAYLLSFFSNLRPVFSYQIAHYQFEVSYTGLVIGIIVVVSAFFELIPRLSKLSFDKKYTVAGGILSGFFGGLSGNQGLLRSAFLIKTNLTKEQFIGTSVICSIIVDVVRLIVYGWSVSSKQLTSFSSDTINLTIAACFAAFAGAYIGSRFIEKITYKTLQAIVGIMLMVLGIAMMSGFIQFTH